MIRFFSFLFLIVIATNFAQAQTVYSTSNSKAIKLFEKALGHYQRRESQKAIEGLLDAIEKAPEFIEAHNILADTYIESQQYEKAIEELKKSIAINPNYDRKTFYFLGGVELGLGKYHDAKVHFEEYLRSPRLDEEFATNSRKYLLNCDFAINAIKNPVPFKPVNMGPEVNSVHEEYFPAITADDQTFLFTRNIRPGKESTYNHSQEDFYYSKKVNGKWATAQSIGPNINTEGNEGAPTLSADGQLLFFVVCESMDGYGLDRKGYGSCDVFVAQKAGDKWGKARNAGPPVNSKAWETQPSFSSDGRTLYFIRGVTNKNRIKSDDIYMAQIQDNGQWSTPVRLSDKVNSPGNEESVFIHPDNQTLYFASNGRVGMGGLDIYMSRRQPDGEWGEAVNLGYPINTNKDDNSLLVNTNGDLAYFASERDGGYGGLDMYYFELDKALRPEKVTYMKGKVFDKETTAPLGAVFELIDLETGKQVIRSGSSDKTGEFLVCLPANKNYALNVSREGYLFYSQNFSLKTTPDNKPFLMDVPLSKPNVDEIVRLDNVFFETNKFELRPESKAELDKLVTFLTKNSKLKIELRGHTDNVGNDKSNMVLSENRAKSVYDYLITNGVDKERLSFKGFGKTLPVKPNDTPENRQVNRRTEFRIVAN